MGNLNRVIRSLVILFLLLFIGCEENDSSLSEVENGNFVLYLSNQSFDIDPVDIRAYIDNKLAVNKEFFCVNQHNWVKFQFNIKNGNHKLYCVADKGNVNIDTTFNLSESPYCVVEFWYYKKTSTYAGMKKELTIKLFRYKPGFG